MKKTLLIIASALMLFAISCSKSDKVETPSTIKIEIHNKSSFDMKVLYLYAITGTTTNDIKKDTTSETRKSYELGALASKKNMTTEIDKKFKSFIVLFTYHNPVLGNKDYTVTVTKLGNGRNAFPFVMGKEQPIILNLDDNMKFEIL